MRDSKSEEALLGGPAHAQIGSHSLLRQVEMCISRLTKQHVHSSSLEKAYEESEIGRCLQ
jgi:hypothetical protein